PEENPRNWNIESAQLSEDGSSLYFSEYMWEYPKGARNLARTHSRITVVDTQTGERKHRELPVQRKSEFTSSTTVSPQIVLLADRNTLVHSNPQGTLDLLDPVTLEPQRTIGTPIRPLKEKGKEAHFRTEHTLHFYRSPTNRYLIQEGHFDVFVE